MSPLDRKLLRDLWRMKGQALAIVLVIASGVATFVMLISTMTSLNITRDRFYRDYGFAEVFAPLKRAPESLKERISGIPGVDRMETRVVADVKLDIRDFPEPVTARLVSLPDVGRPLLNRIFLRNGRLVEAWRDDEVVVSEAFAEAHGFRPGDRIGAVINGRRKSLTITGVALSPEFVLQTRPGAISPDYKRYAVLWMGREALGTAYDMKGAFNDVVLTLSAGSRLNDVLLRLDALLDHYGGLGAVGRKDQLSHRFLSEEFRQLERSAAIFPTIFIAVAAFLLNVVISRMVSTQREQIAALKAFGYSNRDVGIHYAKMVLFIVLIGIAVGIGGGVWLGKGLAKIYMEFYRFPYLSYELKPSVAMTAALITISAALAGTLFSVRKAALLPPAEAMRPEPPAHFRTTLIERLGPGRLLSQPTRIIIRNIERRPIKSLLSVTGIALSCAIMVAGTFSKDAVDFMINVQFRLSQKEDMTVTFTEPTSGKAVYELKSLQGVGHAEVFRSVPVRLSFGHRSYRTSLKGVEPGGTLYSLLDTNLRPVSLPPDGIVLTDYLGKILGVRQGDTLTIEVLEGSRPVRQAQVAGLIKQYIGLMGYMDLGALNRLMREGDAISGVYLIVDPLYQSGIYKRLMEMPRVSGAIVRKDEIRNFYQTQAEALLFFTFVSSILAGIIAFGVVYNSARIALSERSRELASLRVLGYTRAEISYIFLGELGLLTLAAIPLGILIGRGIAIYIAEALSSDLFRIPVALQPATYSLAASVVVVSACLSGLIVRHRLDHLDLVSVLKARE
ncbi:MAG: ABC transporter permease [Nitrospirae bacterium]|nr:ABC transporter permease [Nitrospirota bacterium]